MKNLSVSEETFSLSQGGLFYLAASKVHLENQRWKIALLVMSLTWLPPAIISAFEGTFYSGTPLPFLKDYGMQGRLLIAIPLLILIKFGIYRRIPPVLKYLTGVLMNKEDREYFLTKSFPRAKKIGDSIWIEIIFIFIVTGVAMSPFRGASMFKEQGGTGSWLFILENGKPTLSLAGKWVSYFSIPVFQFLLLKWLWRYFVWVTLLFRVSKMSLKVQPTHPDGAGGLGVILLAHRNFIFLFVTLGLVISGEMVARLTKEDNYFNLIRLEVVGYIILCMTLMIFPLLFFTRRLIRTKQQGLLALGAAGSRLSKKFEEEFVDPLGEEEIISETPVDPSMQVDYSSIYIFLQQLRIVPIRFGEAIVMALLFFLPFVPILFIHFSIAELLQRLVGLLV